MVVAGILFRRMIDIFIGKRVMYNIIFTAIAALAAAVSAIVSAVEANSARKTQALLRNEARKDRTILAYNRLQDAVLDKLVSYPKSEINNIIKTLDEVDMGFDLIPEIDIAYKDLKAMIAKCEHFAVGVNEGLYDINLVNRMGGIHLIYLYKKVAPIIERARINGHSDEPYKEFEKLIIKLEGLQKQ